MSYFTKDPILQAEEAREELEFRVALLECATDDYEADPDDDRLGILCSVTEDCMDARAKLEEWTT